MSISDYVGRTVDVLAYKGGTAGGEKLLRMELAAQDDSGQITTGIQKLAQRFLLELLTEQGTMAYLPLRGCGFMREARLGMWRSPIDVMAAFSAALLDIKDNLQAEETSLDPDDERFFDAELVAVTLDGSEASVTIRVTSLAGTSRKFIAPLKITV
jgi:hypothetical protein